MLFRSVCVCVCVCVKTMSCHQPLYASACAPIRHTVFSRYTGLLRLSLSLSLSLSHSLSLPPSPSLSSPLSSLSQPVQAPFLTESSGNVHIDPRERIQSHPGSKYNCAEGRGSLSARWSNGRFLRRAAAAPQRHRPAAAAPPMPLRVPRARRCCRFCQQDDFAEFSFYALLSAREPIYFQHTQVVVKIQLLQQCWDET